MTTETIQQAIAPYKSRFSKILYDAFYGLPREQYEALLREIRDDAAERIAVIEAERRAELLAICADGGED